MILFFAGFGCSTSPQENNAWNARLRQLEEELERQRQVQQEMKVRQEALIAQLQRDPEPSSATLPEKPAEVPVISEPAVSAADATGLNEQALYAKVLESYRAKSPDLLKRAVAIFVKNFPESVYADNALFLNVRLAFERERWSEVQESGFELETRYPFSNKVAATLLLRAQARHHMGEDREAGRLLQEIQKQFPGSPEASQAHALEKRVKAVW